MVVVFSTTKGATAICAHQLVDEGKLDLDAPVARYWPEFAAAGKEAIPVSYLLSHQAGLAWAEEPLTLEQALAWDPLVEALARQAPAWEPGTKHGYHAVTYGHLVGEVVRRVDGRSIGTYFHEEIAEPLGLQFWIGLPAELEPRVARLAGNGLLSGNLSDEALGDLAPLIGSESMLHKALTGGGAFGGSSLYNSREMHAAELPAAGGISDARSIARMYAACMTEVDGVRLLTDERLRDATTQRTEGPNVVILDFDLQFGLGFNLPSTLVEIGGPRSFGHFGAGGSAGWADPVAELTFGYVMNRMELGIAGDQRCFGLINACYDALA
jgi:CubicO group peptidase (beta-lactamase class C family)